MIRFLLLLPTMLFYDVNSQLSPASDYSLSILQMLQKNTKNSLTYTIIFEPQREKTSLPGFRPGLTQTDLYSHRKELES